MRPIIVAVAIMSQLAGAQEPTAQSIMRRHVEAVGGTAALGSEQHTHKVMTMSMLGPEGVVRIESWTSKPNLSYTRSETPGVGLMEGGYDGKVAWAMSTPLGPQILPNPPTSIAHPSEAMSDWQKLSASYGGVRELEGRRYHVVRVRSPDVGNYTSYFDVETGLLSGMDFEKGTLPGRMTMRFDDYKHFGPRLYATRTTTRMPDGREMVSRIVSLDHNPIDASRYELPPAIKQLASKP